MTETKLYRN